MICTLLLCAVAGAAFLPGVRIDHQNLPNHGCYHAALCAGPQPGFSRPLYAAIEDDSFQGMVAVRSDILFQTSTDCGATWLAQDRLIRRGQDFACYPDITTGADGSVYIVFTERGTGLTGHIYCVRSTDGGVSWTAPAQVDDNSAPTEIGWARVCTDTAGNLFAAWNQLHGSYLRIFSAASTDNGATWSARVRVDDDTVPSDAYHTDVFIQPGTNHYLVAATAPYWVRPGNISSHAALYRSTDRGATFRPGIQLDTFGYYTGQPHVVADSTHIICDYTGSGSGSGNQNATEAHTLYTEPDTWGPCVPVTDLDTLYSSYYNGAKLAISPAAVHTALMICDLVNWEYEIYYAASTDFGASWSARERINDVTTNTQTDPDICADDDGFAYVTWQDQRNNRDEIWFSTNSPLAIEESPKPPAASFSLSAYPTVFRDRVTIRLSGSSLIPQPSSLSICDASGRLVRSLAVPSSPAPHPVSLYWDGRDSYGRRCASGVYVARPATFPAAAVEVVLLPD